MTKEELMSTIDAMVVDVTSRKVATTEADIARIVAAYAALPGIESATYDRKTGAIVIRHKLLHYAGVIDLTIDKGGS